MIQLIILFERAKEACEETFEAKYEIPTTFTPLISTTSSTTEPSTFPPVSTAISRITLPGFIFLIVASSIILGAGLPKI